jgi:hypothetical protein
MSIFDFWSGIPDDAFVHPADAEILARTPHSFDLTAMPHSFTGPLRKARVVLLFLSPGYDPFDTEFAKTTEGRSWYRSQREGFAAMPSLAEHPPGAKWWRTIVRQFGVEPDAVANKLAILNMGAYHSRDFKDWHMLTALPSSRVSLDWAQRVLFPEAISGKRIVICLRSAKYWGLGAAPRYGSGLFVPAFSRNGFMHLGENREAVSAAVRDALAA